jgi:hypothetical protein
MLDRRIRVWFGVFLFPVLVLLFASFVLLFSRRVEAQASPSNKLHDLQEQRLAALRKLADISVEGFKNGQVSADELRSATRAEEEAELELCTSAQERVAVLEKAVAQAKLVEDQEARLAALKLGSETSVLKATAERLHQEILLEQARSK